LDSKTVVPAISAVLALTGALGIAYAVFRSATVQKTLELYKNENEALGKAVARLQADYLTIAAKAEELERANRVLQETVSGREAVQGLSSQLAKYEEARAGEHRAMVTLLDEMREQLAEMWRSVVRALGER
jgi:predicted nuclease with TOPRIM domain